MRILHLNGMTPPALAIAIALAEKGLDFEIVDHDWRQTAQALGQVADGLEVANTLEGEFPVLINDGAAVSDSYFVLEYLDDAYPEPALRPEDAYGQWQVQAFARFFGERVLPAVSTLGVAQRFGPVIGGEKVLAGADALSPERRDAWATAADDNADLLAESRRKLALFAARLDTALNDSDGEWLFGGAFTIADINAFVLAHPFVTETLAAEDVTFGEAVRAWHARMMERPAVKAALALREAAFLPGPEHARWG